MAPALALLSLLTLVAPGGRIVAEWDPGVAEAELGGPLVVDGYGINGLGAYRVAGGGSTVLAVCTQADVGHSLTAEYAVDRTVVFSPELDYLTWAYLRPGLTPTDDQAAAVNALAWRYARAVRRGGGSVWQGDELEVRVLGVGRLAAIEAAIAALHAEATARRGPWRMSALTVNGRAVSVQLRGPGGPIAGVPVRFTAGMGWSVVATTAASGVATANVPAGVTEVRASASSPGPAIALVAPRSQRLATPGPPLTVGAVVILPPPPTTTTTTTSTTTTAPTTTTTTAPTTTTSTAPTTTTTTAPTTTWTTTVAPTTTTSTAPPTTTTSSVPATTVPTSTTIPSTSTTAPPLPTLPSTGSTPRGAARLGAWLFAAGALAVLGATPRRRPVSERAARPPRGP